MLAASTPVEKKDDENQAPPQLQLTPKVKSSTNVTGTPKSALKSSSRASTLTEGSVKSLDYRGQKGKQAKKPADSSESPETDPRYSLDVSQVHNGPYPYEEEEVINKVAQQLQREVAQVMEQSENEPSSSIISKAFEAIKSIFY